MHNLFKCIVHSLGSQQETVCWNNIQDMIGEDNAVSQGLVEARLSHSGAASDLLAGISNLLIHPEDADMS